MTREERYAAAVVLVTEKARIFFSEVDGFERESFEGLKLWKQLGCYYRRTGDGWTIEIEDKAVDELFELQLEDSDARALLSRIVSGKLLFSRYLRECGVKFAGLYISGRLPALKNPRGRNPKATFERQRFLFFLTKHVCQQFSLMQTRTDEPQKNRQCRAVMR